MIMRRSGDHKDKQRLIEVVGVAIATGAMEVSNPEVKPLKLWKGPVGGGGGVWGLG